MPYPVASLMQRQPEATAGGEPLGGGPGEEAGKITRGRLGTQGDNSHISSFKSG